MKNNAKRWIAIAITLLVFVVSVFAKDKEAEGEETFKNKYFKDLTDFSNYTRGSLPRK